MAKEPKREKLTPHSTLLTQFTPFNFPPLKLFLEFLYSFLIQRVDFTSHCPRSSRRRPIAFVCLTLNGTPHDRFMRIGRTWFFDSAFPEFDRFSRIETCICEETS